jgi:clan AA aspartic protease
MIGSMIGGVVNDVLEAIIHVALVGPSGSREEIEAVVDTGFDGYLTLPRATRAALGFPWRRRTRGVLADGSERLFDIYEGAVMWDGRPRRVSVDSAETTPLAGMALLRGNNLLVEVVEGGTVRIEARHESP